MAKNRPILLFLVLVLIVAFSCSKEKTTISAADCPDPISYTNNVKVIIDLNCATSGCHDATASGGYTLTTYSQVSANAGIILDVIKHNSGVTPMPLGGSMLPDSLIQQVECWVVQGKPEN